MLWFLSHRKKMNEKWAQTVGVSKQIYVCLGVCVCVNCLLHAKTWRMDCSEKCNLSLSLSVWKGLLRDRATPINSALIDEWMSQFTRHYSHCSSSSRRVTVLRISNFCNGSLENPSYDQHFGNHTTNDVVDESLAPALRAWIIWNFSTSNRTRKEMMNSNHEFTRGENSVQ